MKLTSRFYLIIFFIQVSIFQALGQSLVMEPPVSINESTIARSRYVQTGDIDNDGKIDILISATNNNTLAWFKNENSGIHFGEINIISQDFYNAGPIKLVDMDKDGDLDVLAAGLRRNNIAWFENTNGKGEFSIRHDIENLKFGISEIIPEDLDMDGDIDILISFWDAGQIAFFENINGNFSERQIIDDNRGIVADIVYGDFDGDNKKDIIASWTNQGKIVFYKRNNNSLIFEEPEIIDSNLTLPTELITSDIDDDGDLDLFTGASQKILWYQNEDGLGNFSKRKKVRYKNNSIETIIAKDFDNDGKKDIIFGQSESNYVAWVKNEDGLGNFSKEKVISKKIPGAYAVAIEDFDGNGTQDVFVSSYYESKLIWFKNLNNNNYSSPITIFESVLKEPTDFITGDFTGDGYLDIVVANSKKKSLIMYKGKNSGNEFEVSVIDEDDGANTRIIEKADIDRDGDLDIISAKESNAGLTLVWYQNNNGIFTSKVIPLSENTKIDILEVIDIDNDGDIDIVMVSRQAGKVRLITNVNGLFTGQLLISNKIEYPSSITLNDFDNDDDIDIVVASSINDSLYYFKNNIDNFTYQKTAIKNENTTVSSMSSEDIDGDGNKDIVYSNISDNSVYWLKNKNGSGSFNDPQKLPISYNKSADQLLLNDIDGDNDFDIILMDESFSTVEWFENKGQSFNTSSNIILKGISGLQRIEIANINKDNYNDLISLSNKENSISLSKGKKASVFTLHPVNVSVCENEKIKFKVDFDSADSIQWQTKTVNSSSFSNIKHGVDYSGVNSKELQVLTKYKLNGNQYRCDLYFNGSIIHSESATLVVDKMIESKLENDFITCANVVELTGNIPASGSGKWSVKNGNASLSSPNNNITDVTNLSAGDNTFTWTITNGNCSDFDDIVVSKKDSALITLHPETKAIYIGEDVSFEINTTGDIKSYQWIKGNIKLTDDLHFKGTKTQKFTIKDAKTDFIGAYQCIVEGVCNSMTSKPANLDITNGINDLSENNIIVYPNPTSGILNILSTTKVRKVKILDMLTSNIIIEINNRSKLDLSSLSKGVYLINIETNNNLITKKIFITD